MTKPPEFPPDVVAFISDKDVSDHHAIIPTAEAGKIDLAALPVGERSLFMLICCKLLCAAASPHEYEAVTAIFDCGGYSFTAKGKHVLIEGWKVFERLFRATLKNKPDDDGEEESELPELVQGKTYECVKSFITEHFTSPPKAYTEDAMRQEVDRLTAQIAHLEQRGMSLYEDYAEGRLDKDDYLAAKAKNQSEGTAANTRLAELCERLAANPVIDSKDACDDSLLQRVLAAVDVTDEIMTLVESITVYDAEHIEIRFNFGDTNV